MADLSGKTLGKYQVIERLGRGGMADVYRAFQPTTDRVVALKVMHGHLADQHTFIERFKREARIVGGLRHPNIVQVIDFDIEGDVYYMVMEFIQGETLKARLEREGALPVTRALEIAASLADALDYAHQEGMLHRDVKPANVMFGKADEPVLTDFSIARIVDATGLTTSGIALGTPAYMSPEAGRGDQVDGRADIYSLGVVLFEMVTGKLPYDADTPYAVILKHMHDPLPTPRQFNPGLPVSVELVVLKALAKNPDDRYQSAAAFCDDLLRVRQGLTDETPPNMRLQRAPGTPITEPLSGAQATVTVGADSTGTIRRARRPMLLALAAVVLLVAAVGLALAGRGGGQAGGTHTPALTTPVPVAALSVTAEPATSEPALAATLTVTSTVTSTATNTATNTVAVPPTQTTAPTAASSAVATAVAANIPADYTGLAAEIKQQVRDGLLDAALGRMQEALKTDPQSVDLLALHGWVLVQFRNDHDQLEAGRASAEKAISLDPSQPFAYFVLAYHFHLSPIEDYPKAFAFYTAAIERNVREPEAYLKRAELGSSFGMTREQLLDDYSKAIALEPENPYLYEVRGDFLFYNKQYAQALPDFEKAFALQPSYARFGRRTVTLILLDRAAEAYALYEKPIETESPTEARFIAEGAYVAWATGRAEQARKWAKLALLLEPATQSAIYIEALLAWDAKRYDEALAKLDAVLQAPERWMFEWPMLNPLLNRQPEADRARILTELGRIDDAIQAYEAGKQADAGWARLYIEQAQLYRRKGQLDEARQMLLKALELNRESGNAAERIEILDALRSLATPAPATPGT